MRVAIRAVTPKGNVLRVGTHVALGGDNVQHLVTGFLLNDLIVQVVESKSVKTTNSRLINAQHAILALHSIGRAISRVSEDDLAAILL